MQTNSYFQFSILLNNVEVEFRYISRSSVINYNGIIVIDPRWDSTIRTMEYFAENTAPSVLTLICSVGSERSTAPEWWDEGKKSAFLPLGNSIFQFFIKSVLA